MGLVEYRQPRLVKWENDYVENKQPALQVFLGELDLWESYEETSNNEQMNESPNRFIRSPENDTSNAEDES